VSSALRGARPADAPRSGLLRIASGPPAGAAGVVAALLMLVALFLPFVSPTAYACNPSSCQPYVDGAAAENLLHAWDGWPVLAVVVALLVAAAACTVWIARLPAAVAYLSLALAGLGLTIYSGVDAADQVLRSEDYSTLVGIGGPTWVLGSGFYLLLTAGLLATATGGAMLLARHRIGLGRAVAMRRWPGVACVGAALAMFVGLLLPFASVSCTPTDGAGYFPGLFTCPQAARAISSNSLAGGMDGWIVTLIVVACAVTAAWSVAGYRRISSALIALLLAATTLGLTLFEAANAGTRVLRWSNWIPAATGAGFYVVLVGSEVALLTAVLLASDGVRGAGTNAPAPDAAHTDAEAVEATRGGTAASA